MKPKTYRYVGKYACGKYSARRREEKVKIIIAGSRGITDKSFVAGVIEMNPICPPEHITEIVSGHCPRGVDAIAEEIAQELDIPVQAFPANWDKYGRQAGPIRNQEMAEYADGLIAIWDGKSRGTKNMIIKAHAVSIPVYVVRG